MKCNNDITSENLKYSQQIYWGCTYLCRKKKGQFSVAIHVLQNSVSISCCSPATGKKGLSFLLWLLVISAEKQE